MRNAYPSYDPTGAFSAFDDEEERRRREEELAALEAPTLYQPPPEPEYPPPGSAGPIGTPSDFGADEQPDPQDERELRAPSFDGGSSPIAGGASSYTRGKPDQGWANAGLSVLAGLLDIGLNKGKGLGAIASNATSAEANRVAQNEKMRQFDAQHAAQTAAGDRAAAYQAAQMKHWGALEQQQLGRGNVAQTRAQLQVQAAERRAAGDDPESEYSQRAREAAAQLGLGEQTAGMSENQIKQFMTALNMEKRIGDAPRVAQNAATQAGMTTDAKIGAELARAPQTTAVAVDEARQKAQAGADVDLATQPGIAAATTAARGVAEAATPEAVAKRTAARAGAESDFEKGQNQNLTALRAIQGIKGNPRAADGGIAGFSRGEQLQSKVPYGNDIAEFFGGERLAPEAQDNIQKMLIAANALQRKESGAAAPLQEAAGFVTRAFGDSSVNAAERERAMLAFEEQLTASIRGAASNTAAAKSVSERSGVKGLFDDPGLSALEQLPGLTGDPPASKRSDIPRGRALVDGGAQTVMVRNRQTGETRPVTPAQAAKAARNPERWEIVQ